MKEATPSTQHSALSTQYSVLRHAPFLLIPSLTLFFFHKLAFSNLILGRGDLFLYFYPYWHAAAERLSAGSIPLWNPNLFMGAPFLANSQAGVLYPLNWPLWLLLPTPYAVSASILLHLMIAGWGTYRLGKRMMGLGTAAAFLAAVLFALGGYLTAQVEHVNQLQGLAWLPWVLWGVSGFRFQVSGSEFRVSSFELKRNRSPFTIYHLPFTMPVLLIALFFALQLLAGHTQTAFITGVGAAAVVAVGYLRLTIDDLRLTALRNTQHTLRLTKHAAPLLIGTLLAMGLAAAQLLPTLELTSLSSRQGGLPFNEAVSFSLHPLLLTRSLLPAYGQSLFSEYVAFLPLTVLLLALVGAWNWRRDRAVWPVLLLVGLGLFLALGRFNPAYWLLARLPGFDLFRVPARWLALYSLGMALLAGAGWERATGEQGRKVIRYGVLGLGLLMVWGVVSVPLARFIPIGPEAPPEYPSWLTLRGWFIELTLSYWLLTIGSWPRAAGRWLSVVAPLILVAASLYLASRTLPYHANATTPEAFFDLRPPITRVLSSEFPVSSFASGNLSVSQSLSLPPARFLSLSDIFFDVGDQAEIDTIYEGRLSALAQFDYTVAIKQKEVMAPNLPLVYGLAAADGFDGGILPLRAYSQLTTLILPEGVVTTDGRLRENLDAVPESRWLDLFNIGYVITDKVGDVWLDGVFFDLQHPVTLTDAAAVGHIPPYEATAIRFVAPSGDFVVDITTPSGQTWHFLTPEPIADGLWEFNFPEPTTPTAITVSPLRPLAPSPPHINGLSLVDSRDNSFQPLVLGDYRLIHSGDVKIYENLDVLPRAFLVNEWAVADDAAAALRLMRDPSFDPTRQAVVSSDQSPVSSLSISQSLSLPVSITTYQPEHIELTVNAAAPALLILTDAYYPGWRATLDGEPVTIHQTDVLFRGVFVPEGEHQLVMTFAPESWARGRVISLVALLLWLGLGVVQLHAYIRH